MIETVPPDSELHLDGCWYCGAAPHMSEVGLLWCYEHQPASAVVREDAKKGIARERVRIERVARPSGWQVVKKLSCGCELIDLPAEEKAITGQEPSIRVAGACVYHLCRICGAVPLADNEPDRLCHDCSDKG